MNTVVMINKIPYEMTPEQKAVYEFLAKELQNTMLKKEFIYNSATQEEREARASVLDYAFNLSTGIVLALDRVRKEQNGTR